MKPKELLDKYFEQKGWYYFDCYGGSQDSINRLIDRDCVVGYYNHERLLYIIMINTKNEVRLYRAVGFDTNTYRHTNLPTERVTDAKSIFKTLQLKFKILNQRYFDEFKKTIIMEAVTSGLNKEEFKI